MHPCSLCKKIYHRRDLGKYDGALCCQECWVWPHRLSWQRDGDDFPVFHDNDFVPQPDEDTGLYQICFYKMDHYDTLETHT